MSLSTGALQFVVAQTALNLGHILLRYGELLGHLDGSTRLCTLLRDGLNSWDRRLGDGRHLLNDGVLGHVHH